MTTAQETLNRGNKPGNDMKANEEAIIIWTPVAIKANIECNRSDQAMEEEDGVSKPDFETHTFKQHAYEHMLQQRKAQSYVRHLD